MPLVQRRFYKIAFQDGLTHWGRVTHICVSELTRIGSYDGLSPGRRQAIIWINAGILSIGPLGTNFSEILFEMLAFSFDKMRLKMSSVKWQPFCLGLNVLRMSNYIPQKFTDVITYPWWRHQMETFSALLAFCAENSPVPGEFSAQRSVTRSFDVFFDLRLNKRLSKHLWGWWFETLSRPLWRHRNDVL